MADHSTPRPWLTRRALLRTGLFGAAAVVVGSTGLALRETVLRPLPAAGLKLFSPTEFAVLAAIAERVAPPASTGAPTASALEVAERADAALALADPETQKGMQIALHVFESGLAGALFAERVTPFTQLLPAAQDRVLQAWKDSSVGFRRTVFQALTSLCAALYYGDRRAWHVAGYPGPPSPQGLRVAFAMNLVDLHALKVGGQPGRTPDLPSSSPTAPGGELSAEDGTERAAEEL